MSKDSIYELMTEYDFNKPSKVTIEFEGSEGDEDISSNNYNYGIEAHQNNDNIESDESTGTTESTTFTNCINSNSKYFENRTVNSSKLQSKDKERQNCNLYSQIINNIGITSDTTKDTLTNNETGDLYVSSLDRHIYLSEVVRTLSKNVSNIILSQSSPDYIKIKYKIYRDSYNVIRSIKYLSQEERSLCVSKVLEHTLKLTTDKGVMCNFKIIEVLLVDMIEWARTEILKDASCNPLNQNTTQQADAQSHGKTVSGNEQRNICIYKCGPAQNEISISVDSSILQTLETQSRIVSSVVNSNSNTNKRVSKPNYRPVKRTNPQQSKAIKHIIKKNQTYSQRFQNGYSPSNFRNAQVPQIAPNPRFPGYNQATYCLPFNNGNPPKNPRYPTSSQTASRHNPPNIAPPNFPYLPPPTPYYLTHFQFSNNNSSSVGTLHNMHKGSSPPILPHSQSPPYQGARLPQEQSPPSRNRMDPQRDTNTLPTHNIGNHAHQPVTPILHNALSPVLRNEWIVNANMVSPNSGMMTNVKSLNRPPSSTVDSQIVCQICGENAKTKCAYRNLLLSQT